MAIRVLKEVSREGGRLPATGASVIAGIPLELASATTVRPYQGGANTLPLGLASDSNILQPLQGPNGLTVGVGYDYTNFNRGGLIGAFLNGGVYELWNDGTGYPFDQVSYALNEAVYANSSTGKVNSAAGANGKLVGVCMGIVGSPVTRLTLKLLI